MVHAATYWVVHLVGSSLYVEWSEPIFAMSAYLIVIVTLNLAVIKYGAYSVDQMISINAQDTRGLIVGETIGVWVGWSYARGGTATRATFHKAFFTNITNSAGEGNRAIAWHIALAIFFVVA